MSINDLLQISCTCGSSQNCTLSYCPTEVGQMKMLQNEALQGMRQEMLVINMASLEHVHTLAVATLSTNGFHYLADSTSWWE